MNEEFKNRIISLCGVNGQTWLNSIPSLIAKYEKEWNIKTQPPFKLSYNYVCPATTNRGKLVVLKISFPDNKEFLTEVEAIKAFNDDVSIRILEEDLPGGAVLLERADPGSQLSSIKSNSEQVHYASQVIKRLHYLITEDQSDLFQSIADWAKAFERYRSKFNVATGPLPKKLFDQGEGIFRELLQDKNEQAVLHGDLHSDNILLSDRGWLVIDPKGVIGEREFELGAYLRNPYYDLPKGSDYKKVEAGRIIQFSEELGFDKERIRSWALACAVISMIWFLEDENTFKDIYVRNAELLRELKI